MKRNAATSCLVTACLLFLTAPLSAQTQDQTTNGPDVIVSAVGSSATDIGNSGTLSTPTGDVTGYALGSVSCNIGNATAVWFETSNQHPPIGQNMYRFMKVNGAFRYEQIGMSWLKHGFCAADAPGGGCSVVGHPCSSAAGCDLLGVGCSDTYGQSLNANQEDLGPHSEVNPTTCVFPYPYILGGPHQTGNAIYKRMQVHVSDINTNISPTPRYMGEVQYMNTDEPINGNNFNNVSYREILRGTLAASGGYNLSFTGPTIQMQPAINAWATLEAGVTTIPIQTLEANTNLAPAGGRIYLAYKVTDLSGTGGGPYHYEYAIYNMNSDRAIQSFSVPLIGNALSNVGFHDVEYHSGEPYSLTDWTPTTLPVSITWATQTFAQNVNANALRWGTTYNFRFDTAQPPINGTATLTYFKPVTGRPNTITVAIKVPASADCNTNGTQDQTDISNLTSKDCNTNLIPDECEPDCNTNGTADRCDISSGLVRDCNTDFIPDVCNSATNLADRNSNGVPDICDDCNSNGTFDAVEVLPDCNTNGLPDTCDANFGLSPDCNSNLVLDVCEPDCNTNHTADACEIGSGALIDTDGDTVPDVCDNCDFVSNVDQNPWLNHVLPAANSGLYNSISQAPDGHIGVSSYRILGTNLGALQYWDDLNGDLVPQPGEILTVDASTANVGQYTSLRFDAGSRAMIAYYDASNRDLKFWYDDNKSLSVDGGELQTIDEAGNTGQTPSLRLDPAGHATVAYFRVTNNALMVWHDVNGNHAADAGELTVIDGMDPTIPGGINGGQYSSLVFDWAGRAVVSYYQNGDRTLKLWVDLNTNYLPDAGEIRVIDNSADVGQYSSLALDNAGKATIAYYNATDGGLKLFHDANGNYAADAGEVVTIDTAGNPGQYASLAFDASGSAMVAYYRVGNKTLRLWRDINANFAVNAGETSLVRSGADVGSYASLIFHGGRFAPMIAYRDNTNLSGNFTAQLDWDGDGACFANDNCPGTFNPTQADANSNGTGDACEVAFACGDRNRGDINGDQVMNAADVVDFVSVVLDPAASTSTMRCAADINADGSNDGKDISLFVGLMLP